MKDLMKKSSLKYVFISVGVVVAGLLSALWVYAGN